MNVSLSAIILSGIAEVIIGSVWYHKHVFCGAWMRMSHITPEAAERMARQRWFRPPAFFIAGILIAYVLGSIGVFANITTPVHALQLAFLTWAGFIVPALFITLFLEGRQFPIFFINAGYWLVSSIAIVLILIML